MLIIGEQEAADGTVSVRRHKEGDLGSMPLERFIEFFQQAESASKEGK
jgi:threonyl-tRNA synthetase